MGASQNQAVSNQPAILRPALAASASWILIVLLSASWQAAAAQEQAPGVLGDSALYVKVRLTDPVKASKLKPGDVIEGKLSRGVYSGSREVFPDGSAVHLTVDTLARRKKQPNDHWPWIVRMFSPRHEKYPTFRTVTVTPADGPAVPLQVSLLSFSPKIDVNSEQKEKKKKPADQKAATAASPEKKKQPATPTVVLEAAEPADEERTAAAQPSAIPQDLAQLIAGAQAKVVLLDTISAGKSKPGDTFRARLIEPLHVGSKLVLPEGSLLQGSVLKATPPKWASRAGSLSLKFTGVTSSHAGNGVAPGTLSGIELDQNSRSYLDAEGQLHGGRPGKAWMLANLGATFAIGKAFDDGTQLVIEAIASTATDASTAGVARIAALASSGVFLLTRHGRDIILPKFTEMEITFDRPTSVSAPQ